MNKLEKEIAILRETVSVLSERLDQALEDGQFLFDRYVKLKMRLIEAKQRVPKKYRQIYEEASQIYEQMLDEDPTITPGSAAWQLTKKWSEEGRDCPSYKRLKQNLKLVAILHAGPPDIDPEEEAHWRNAFESDPLNTAVSSSDIIEAVRKRHE